MRILSILAQKPYATGSGVYCTELIGELARAGHTQALICGIDAEEPYFDEFCERVSEVAVFPVRFNSQELPFDILGMSDVMPYRSTRYRDLTKAQAKAFEQTFLHTIRKAVEEFQPELILCHHLYFLSALVLEQDFSCKIAVICHGTCLRQLGTHSFERERILKALASSDRIFALQAVQKQEIERLLDYPADRIAVIGNGYNPAIFYGASEKNAIARGRNAPGESFFDNDLPVIEMAYAGKISRSKGLLSLLAAIDRADLLGHRAILYLAGNAGDRTEYARIVERAARCRHRVEFLGHKTQQELAELYRRVQLFVFASYYEGLGLSAIEAMATGLYAVVSDTPGLQDWILSKVAESPAEFVPLPTMTEHDVPVESELAEYERAFAEAITRQIRRLRANGYRRHSVSMEAFSWESVAKHILSEMREK